MSITTYMWPIKTVKIAEIMFLALSVVVLPYLVTSNCHQVITSSRQAARLSQYDQLSIQQSVTDNNVLPIVNRLSEQ